MPRRPKSHSENFSVEVNPDFDVDMENRKPVKTYEDVSVQKISCADVEHRGGLFKRFEEVTGVPKTDVGFSDANSTNRGLAKMCDSWTSRDCNAAVLKQNVVEPMPTTMNCRGSDAVRADSGYLQEKNSEVYSLVGDLSGSLTADELHQVYSRVFCRR